MNCYLLEHRERDDNNRWTRWRPVYRAKVYWSMVEIKRVVTSMMRSALGNDEYRHTTWKKVK